jgi:hypothetical protein
VIRTTSILHATVVLAGLSGGIAHAQRPDLPSLYSTQRLTGIRNDTSSPLVGDHNVRRGAYVLPPTTGTSILSQFVPGQNLQHCRTMMELQQASRELTVQMAALALNTEPLNVALEGLREQKRLLRDTLAENADYRALERQVAHMEDDIEDISDRILDLQDYCADLGSECPPSVGEEIADLEAERAELEAEVKVLTALAANKRSAYQAAERELAVVEANETRVSTQITTRLAELNQAREQILAMYSQYAKLEGGQALIAYQSGWDANIVKLKRANPGYWFRPISTSEARVYAGLAGGIGSDNYLASNPSITSYSVNGQPVADGSAAIPFATYPKNVNVEANLSLVAACVQTNPEFFDIEKSDTGLPLFAMTVTYKYPTVYFTDVTAVYNPWRIYQRIREVGGLWSARVSAVLDRSAADRIWFDWYDTVVDVAASRAGVKSVVAPEPEPDLAVRRDAEKRLTHEAIQEVMAVIGETRFGGDTFSRLDMPVPPQASVLGPASLLEPFVLRPMTSTGRFRSILEKVTVTPRDGECEATDAASASAVAPRPSIVVAVPGQGGVTVNEIAFRGGVTPRELRVIANAIQLAKPRASYECGWFSIWCDGQTWVERVRDQRVIQQLLDGWRRKVYSRQVVTYRLGSTVYTP